VEGGIEKDEQTEAGCSHYLANRWSWRVAGASCSHF